MTGQQRDKRELLRRSIEERQGDLHEAVLDLQRVVEGGIDKLDLRRKIARDPMPWLAGAFAMGFILGIRRG